MWPGRKMMSGWPRGVLSILVDIGVEGGVVVVINVLFSLGLMIELDSVGSTSTECVVGVERCY